MNPEPSATPIPPDHQLPENASTGERPPRKHRIWAWIVVFLVFGIVIWLVWHHKAAPAAGPGGGRGAMGGPVTTVTAKVTEGDIGVYQDAIGTVTSVYTSSIVSQVTGQVIAVHYKEGQLVNKGTPLVDIDPRPYAATLKQAEGILERDQGVLGQAQMDLVRYRTAWEKNGIAKQQLDDQEKIVEQDQGTVKNDEGTVDYDKVQLGFCHIVSPIKGRVGLRLVDPGNLVMAGGTTTLAVVTQLQPITVVFTISEDNLPTVLAQMHKGPALEVQAQDRAQNKILAKGKLLTADNQIDTTTGTVKLRASYDNKDLSLFPNQFVNTRLLVNTLRNVTLLPSSTIQHNGTQAFVWEVRNGAAQMQNVTTGVTDNNMTQVTGVNLGDEVANGSFEKLQPGSKIVPPGQPSGGNGNGQQHGQKGKKGPPSATSTGTAGSGAP